MQVILGTQLNLDQRVKDGLASQGLDAGNVLLGNKAVGLALGKDHHAASGADAVVVVDVDQGTVLERSSGRGLGQVVQDKGLHLKGLGVGLVGQELVKEVFVLVHKVVVLAALGRVEGIGGGVDAGPDVALAQGGGHVLDQDLGDLRVGLEGAREVVGLGNIASRGKVVDVALNEVRAGGDTDVADGGVGERAAGAEADHDHGAVDNGSALTDKEIHHGNAHA